MAFYSHLCVCSYGTRQLTDGCWSPTKFSVFFTTREDGCVEAWDLLQQRHKSVLSIKVCDVPLRSIRVHEQGQMLAAGGDGGTTHLYQLSDHLAVPQKNDKPMLTEVKTLAQVLKFWLHTKKWPLPAPAKLGVCNRLVVSDEQVAYSTMSRGFAHIKTIYRPFSHLKLTVGKTRLQNW